MVKLGREIPVASMDNTGKIIWAKHNEIQTANIKSIGADYEVQAVLVTPILSHRMTYLFICLADAIVLFFSTLGY